MSKKESRRFIAVLKKQLLEDDTVTAFEDDARLREAFGKSIDSLPDGRLRAEIGDNFDAYYKQLQRSVVKRKRVPTVASAVSGPARVLLFAPGQLERRLSDVAGITDPVQQCDVYIQLLQGSHSNGDWQLKILQHWIGNWNADATFSVEDGIKITKCTALITKQEAKLEWLRLCLKVFLHLVEAAPPNMADECHKKLKQLILNCLYISQPNSPAMVADFEYTPLHYDQLSAILSLYVEYLLTTTDGDHVTPLLDHVISLMHMLLGCSGCHYMDTILQISLGNTPTHHLPLVLSLYRYVVDRMAGLPMDSKQYTKYLCCCINANLISRKTSSVPFKITKMATPPVNCVQWLSDVLPKLVRQSSVLQTAADCDVISDIVCNGTQGTFDDLLDLVCEDRVPDVTSTPLLMDRGTSTGFYIDTTTAGDDINTEEDGQSNSLTLQGRVSTLIGQLDQPLEEIDHSEPDDEEDVVLGSSMATDDPHNAQDFVENRGKKTHKLAVSITKKISSREATNSSGLYFVDATPTPSNKKSPVSSSLEKKWSLRRTPRRTTARYYLEGQ